VKNLSRLWEPFAERCTSFQVHRWASAWKNASRRLLLPPPWAEIWHSQVAAAATSTAATLLPQAASYKDYKWSRLDSTIHLHSWTYSHVQIQWTGPRIPKMETKIYQEKWVGNKRNSRSAIAPLCRRRLLACPPRLALSSLLQHPDPQKLSGRPQFWDLD